MFSLLANEVTINDIIFQLLESKKCNTKFDYATEQFQTDDN